jgi:hypothetical protein
MEHAGDALRKIAAKKGFVIPEKPITPKSTERALIRKQKREAAAKEIRYNRAGVKPVFMPQQLVACTLPHRDPGDVPIWRRTNGSIFLGIQPGYDLTTGKCLGYPYGSLPRLVLFWLTAQAKRQRNACLKEGKDPRCIELGNSLANFMRELDLDPYSRGKRSDYRRLKDQMQRLFRCRISFQPAVQGIGLTWDDMQVAPHAQLWWDPRQPDQLSLWGVSHIILGEAFYATILASTVPADMRALKALKQSSLALDLYAWAGLKVWQVNKRNRPMPVRWDDLLLQLGSDYDPKRIDKFKTKVKAAFKDVAEFFPTGLNIEYAPYALTFNPGAALSIPNGQ